MHLAAYLRGWYTMGYRLGDKFMKISSNSRSSKIKKIQDLLSRNRYVYLSRMTSGSLEDVLHKIDSYKPKIVRCYSDPLLLLAALKKNKTNSHIPTAINTTGNILSASAREQIETAFGCKIFDSYSCEGNAVVFECPTHTCYHSTEEYSITEVLGPDSTVITEGVGKLIATDLWNFAHPFIRYDTQDLLELDNSDCMCGRQHLKVKRILGRDTEMLTTSSGNTFIVHEFTIFFSTNELLNKSVDQFQIINTKASVKMNIVVNNKFNDNIKSLLQTYWEEMLDMPVEICIVESISLGANSKRKFIINE
jgi:phenylacetate-CoA ligase